MANSDVIIGETIGVEFETDLGIGTDLEKFCRDFNWRGHHDASIETPGFFINNLFIQEDVNNPYYRQLRNSYGGRNIAGTELVSPIILADDLYQQITILTKALENGGEPYTSERSSIHFHVSMGGLSVKTLKSIIRMARYFEPLFYYMGSAGYKFRGESNDAIYCRPITSFGPACVKVAGNPRNFWGQCTNIVELVKATTPESFWEKYGDAQYHSRRYDNPARYSWINLLRLYPKGGDFIGTLEFRMLNKTLNPKIIFAVMRACQKFSQTVIKMGFNDYKDEGLLATNSIFEFDKSKVFPLLEEFSDITNLEGKHVDTLRKTISMAPEIKLKTGFVQTHKNIENVFWSNSDYKPDEINRPRKPIYVDIHVLGH